MSQRFNVCDLNAIETRVGAWLAQCHDLMQVFEPWIDPKGVLKPNGRCPYLSFGGKLYGLPFEKLYADYEGWNGKENKAAAKRMRQISKPPVLGSIYRLAGGGLMYVYSCPECKHNWTSKSGGVVICPKCDISETYTEKMLQYSKKNGLFDYADKMGIEMSQEQAHEATRVFRDSYPEICDPKVGIWKQLENAVMDVLHPDHSATVRYVGPNNCVKIDRVNISGRHPMMRMRLPSGRYLHYFDARVENWLKPWKAVDDDGNETDAYGATILYAGTNQKTKQWDIWVSTHGGKLFENLVQGIARDILATKLLEFEEHDMPVVGHVHDEGICLVPDDPFSPGVEDMVEIMSKPIDWAPGLLLGADGFESSYYRK